MESKQSLSLQLQVDISLHRAFSHLRFNYYIFNPYQRWKGKKQTYKYDEEQIALSVRDYQIVRFNHGNVDAKIMTHIRAIIPVAFDPYDKQVNWKVCISELD